MADISISTIKNFDGPAFQSQIDQLEEKIGLIDNKLEMILNLLSGANIEGIETKIKEIENEY